MLIIYSAGKGPVGGEYVRVKNKRIVTVLTHFFFTTSCGGVCKSGAGFFFPFTYVFFFFSVSFLKRLIGVNLSKLAKHQSYEHVAGADMKRQ